MNDRNFLKNKTLRNALWIIGGRLVHKGLAFCVGILAARYLGPGNYGLIDYVAAYTTFFASLCTLGIDSVIIKDFVEHPEEEGQAIGTTLVLRGASSLLSGVMILGIVAIADRGEKTTLLVAALGSIGLVFRSFDTVQQWFQSRLKSRYVSMAALIAFAAAACYKLALLVTGRSVEWFALATAVEHVVLAAILLTAYRRSGGPKLCFSRRKAKALLGASGSYILSGLMISVYAATDRLMLKHMLDTSAVGYYGLAVSLSTAWGFVLRAVIDSVYPDLIRSYSRGREVFERKNRQLYAMVIYGALAASVAVCLLARPIVAVLYGDAYLAAVPPLRIVVWYTVFSYLGVARNAWVVCENKQRYLTYLYFGAAVVNVLLNLAMIPRWGTSGAAWASLLTQVATTVVLPLLIPALRPNGRLMLEAAMLKDVFSKGERYGHE